MTAVKQNKKQSVFFADKSGNGSPFLRADSIKRKGENAIENKTDGCTVGFFYYPTKTCDVFAGNPEKEMRWRTHPTTISHILAGNPDNHPIKTCDVLWGTPGRGQVFGANE